MSNRWGIKELGRRVPVPIAGLMLGLAGAGNLVANYNSIYKALFGIAATSILALLILKAIFDYRGILAGFKNPVIASVAPTFSMAIMILATYLLPGFPIIAKGVWMAAILLHIILIIYFTKEYIAKFALPKVFPSYFIVYVGIVVGSVTAPAFNAPGIGRGLFWFGFLTYLLLLPVVGYRVLKAGKIPEAAIPTITIFAAPASLCLAGYMSSFAAKNLSFVYFLLVLSLFMTSAILIYLPKMLKIPFYPSYSAFTFPLVISAIALKKTGAYLGSMDMNSLLFKSIAIIAEIIAVAIVLYVLIRYVRILLPVSREESFQQ